MSTPEVSVVIVSHNGTDWLRRCLTALLDDARPVTSFEVVVVDSGSDRETLDLLDEWSSRVVLDVAGENVGFARGCNRGVRLATGRRVLLLNPDAVVEPGCVDALVEALDEHPGAGVVGGRTLRPDGTLDPSSCWGAPTPWSWFCFATGLSAVLKRHPVFDPESLGRWQRDTEREVDIVTGCLLMTTRETWDALGGLDTAYFMYGEDADFCLRAAARGWRPRITPRARAVHAVGASSSRRPAKTRMLMTGKATLARRLWSPTRARVGLAMLLGGVALRAGAERLRRVPDPSWLPLWRDRSWLAGWTA